MAYELEPQLTAEEATDVVGTDALAPVEKPISTDLEFLGKPVLTPVEKWAQTELLAPAVDDLAQDYKQAQKDRKAQPLVDEAQANYERYKSELDKEEGKSTKKEPDPSDPLGVRLPDAGPLLVNPTAVYKGMKFLAQGVAEAPLQIPAGIIDGTWNTTLKWLDRFGSWLNDNLSNELLGGKAPESFTVMSLAAQMARSATQDENAWMGTQKGEGESQPALKMKDLEIHLPKPHTTAGGVVRGLSEFLAPFALINKGIKAATASADIAETIMMGETARKWAKGAYEVATGEVAAAITANLVFDPHEQRLSNLLNSFPTLQNPVFEYLQANKEDSEAEARLKITLESLGLGVLATPFVYALGAMKNSRVGRGLEPGMVEDVKIPGMVASVRDLDTGKIYIGNTHQDALYPLINEIRGGRISDLTDEQFIELGKKFRLEMPENMTGSARSNFINSIEDAIIGKLNIEESFLNPTTGQLFSREEAAKIHGIPNEAYHGEGKLGSLHLDTNDYGSGSPNPNYKPFFDKYGGEFKGPITPKIGEPDIDVLGVRLGGIKETKVSLKQREQELLTAIEKAGDRSKFGKELKDVQKRLANGETHETKIEYDPNAGLFTKTDSEVWQRLTNGTATPEDIAHTINWRQFSETMNVDEAVAKLAETIRTGIDEAKRGKLSERAMLDLSDSTGLTVKQLMDMHPGMAGNAETIIAAHKLDRAAEFYWRHLGWVARNSTDMADLFAFHKMKDIYAGIHMRFMGLKSEAGRALRATQVPVGTVDKQIADMATSVMTAGGPDELKRLAIAVTESNNPSAIIKPTTYQKVRDMIIEAWYFNLLSGPVTHAVNAASNTINTLWRIPERYLAAKMPGTGVVEGEAGEMAWAMMEAIPKALILAGKAAVKNESSFSKFDHRPTSAWSAERLGFRTSDPGSTLKEGLSYEMGLITDAAGFLVTSPSRALLTMDEFFGVIGRDMQTSALAYRRATNEGLTGEAMAARITEIKLNPDKFIKGEAEEFAKELTFTKELGPTGQAIQAALNRHPTSKFLVPFIRTPANLLKFAGQTTPLGLFAKSTRDAIGQGGAEGQTALARMALGSAITMAFADLAFRGMITGSGPSKFEKEGQELRATWERTHRPYSISLDDGKTWYNYNRADPFGLVLGAAASYAEIFAHTEDYESLGHLAGAVALATSQSVFNKTWMRGPSEALEAFTQPDKYGEKWISRFLGTLLVPTGVAQINRAIDPVWKETYEILDVARSRIPGLSNSMPPDRNLWGVPRYHQTIGPEWASPITTFTTPDSPIDKWMYENRVNVRMPNREWDGVELKGPEMDRFIVLAGNELKHPGTNLGAYDTLNAIIKGEHPMSAAWKMGTDGPEGTRADMVKDVISEYRDLAKMKVQEEFPDLKRRVDDRLEEVRKHKLEGPGEKKDPLRITIYGGGK